MLELWDRHRESHEESVLVVDTSVVLEEHRDATILMDDRLGVESSHEVEREMLMTAGIFAIFWRNTHITLDSLSCIRRVRMIYVAI
jgi:hypothetical protein